MSNRNKNKPSVSELRADASEASKTKLPLFLAFWPGSDHYSMVAESDTDVIILIWSGLKSLYEACEFLAKDDSMSESTDEVRGQIQTALTNYPNVGLLTPVEVAVTFTILSAFVRRVDAEKSDLFDKMKSLWEAYSRINQAVFKAADIPGAVEMFDGDGDNTEEDAVFSTKTEAPATGDATEDATDHVIIEE